jgi:hypothetical protein
MNAAPHESRTKASPIAVSPRPGANRNGLIAPAKFGQRFTLARKKLLSVVLTQHPPQEFHDKGWKKARKKK